MSLTHVWSDGSMDIEPKMPSGKGARWIIIGADSREDGWIKENMIFWKGNVQSEDYHSEMNAGVFVNWLSTKLLSNINKRSMVAIDRAPYHIMLTDDSKPATGNMKRLELIDWIVKYGVKDENSTLYTADRFNNDMRSVLLNDTVIQKQGWQKTDILTLGKSVQLPKKYVAQQIIDEYNLENEADIKLLILPVTHPILNPIEMMWGQIKFHVRTNNTDQNNMEDIKNLATAKMNL